MANTPQSRQQSEQAMQRATAEAARQAAAARATSKAPGAGDATAAKQQAARAQAMSDAAKAAAAARAQQAAVATTQPAATPAMVKDQISPAPRVGGGAPKPVDVTKEAHAESARRQVRIMTEQYIRALPKEIQKTYKEGDIDSINKAIDNWNQKVAHQKSGIALGELYKKESMAEYIKEQPVELRDAYLKGGVEAYNQAVEDYNKKVQRNNARYNSIVAELERGGYKEGEGYDVASYLRDHPEKEKELLIVFDTQSVSEAKEHNKKYYGIGATEYVPRRDFIKQYFKDKGWDYSIHRGKATVKELKQYDVNLANANAAYDSFQESLDKPQVSLAHFIKNYFENKGWDNKRPSDGTVAELTEYDNKLKEAREFYKQKYGTGAVVSSAAARTLGFVFIPARALDPAVPVSEIQSWEWAAGAGQLMLLATPIKKIPIPISTGIKVAATSAFVSDTVMDTVQSVKEGNFSATNLAVSVAIDAAIIYALFIHPALKAKTKSAEIEHWADRQRIERDLLRKPSLTQEEQALLADIEVKNRLEAIGDRMKTGQYAKEAQAVEMQAYKMRQDMFKRLFESLLPKRSKIKPYYWPVFDDSLSQIQHAIATRDIKLLISGAKRLELLGKKMPKESGGEALAQRAKMLRENAEGYIKIADKSVDKNTLDNIKKGIESDQNFIDNANRALRRATKKDRQEAIKKAIEETQRQLAEKRKLAVATRENIQVKYKVVKPGEYPLAKAQPKQTTVPAIKEKALEKSLKKISDAEKKIRESKKKLRVNKREIPVKELLLRSSREIARKYDIKESEFIDAYSRLPLATRKLISIARPDIYPEMAPLPLTSPQEKRKAAVRPFTIPYTQPEPKPETKPQPEMQPQPKQRIATEQELLPTPEPFPGITPQPELDIPTTTITTTTTPPPPPPKLKLGDDDKEKRKVIALSKGAIAWRMGQLHGKPRWDVIVNPYKSNEHYMMVFGKPPKGAAIAVGGPKSAYRTAQMLYGKPPSKAVHVDSGFQDIIATASGRNIKLHFKPDPKLETKGDISIGQRNNRISERMPRISNRIRGITGRRGVRISPKMRKLS